MHLQGTVLVQQDEINRLTAELEAVKKERDNYKQMIKEQWACPELATCQQQRDELKAYWFDDADPAETKYADEYALAKVGADKGEVG